MERGICSIVELYMLRLTSLVKIFTAIVGSQQNPSLKLSPFATSDIIGYVTIGFVIHIVYIFIYGFLLEFQFQPTVFLAVFLVPERFWDHDVGVL